MTEQNNILPVISFYDLHAADYNSHMSASDDKVRLAIRQVFNDYISDGTVFDFGGGTGLDLLWLSEYYRKVLFLEPSVNMRAEAHKAAKGRLNISFVEDNIDFNNWSSDTLPFSEKVNGVIANFAVFNCIRNISTLFEKLASVCAKDGYVIVAVLNTSFGNLIKNYPLKFAVNSVLNRQIEVVNTPKGISHIIYLHTIRQYSSAAKEYFQLIDRRFIPDSNFMVLIFKKK